MVRKPLKKSKSNASPSVLPKRYEQKHNKYVSSNSYGGTLESVSLSISTGIKPSEYAISELEGDTFRTLRRYGLILARYQIVDKKKFAKKHGYSMTVVNAACRIAANYLYTDTYEEDPSIGTTHTAPLINALQRPNAPSELAVMALAYAGTEAYDDIATAVTDPHLLGAMMEGAEWFKEHLTSGCHRLARLRYDTNDENRYERKRAMQVYSDICRHLFIVERDIAQRRINEQDEEEKRKQKEREKSKKKPDNNGKPKKRELESLQDGWAIPILAKPELTISHSGLMGRRLKASKEGKYVRDLGRIISDPEQRIFGRKTRALGGVVVVDCSGSMSLTEDEMKAIMRASSGCTVIAYSDGQEEGEANIWLVARKGRQVRQLPIFPGGNGVDGPALEYGLTHRRASAPMVWISDTQVTGAQDSSHEELRKYCMRLCRKHNIHIAPNCETATDLLKRLQRGDRVINSQPKEK
jgi:hypothetical protein